MRAAVMTSLVTGVAAAACGGASQPSEGVVDMVAARTSVDQAGKIAAAMSAMNGRDVAVGVEAMMIAHHAVVTPSGNLDARGGLRYPYLSVGVPPPGNSVCTATSCAFTRYGFGMTYLSVSLDGTVTRSGDSLTFDVTYDLNGHLSSEAWTVDGALSVTADLIDGSVHSHGTGSREYAGITWDIVVDYRAITLDTQGCPIGGSLHVVTSYDVSQAAQQVGSPPGFEVQGTASFGPTCP